MLNLSKKQYIQLIKTLEIRNLTLGVEMNLENDFKTVEITDEQHDYLTSFEELQHQIYSESNNYNLQDEFEIHPDTSLLVLKSDSKLYDSIFDSVDKQEQAIIYEGIVKHVVIKKTQELKQKHSPKELDFSQLNPIILGIAENLYSKLIANGLSSVLAQDLDLISDIDIMKQLFIQFSQIAINLGAIEFSENQIKQSYLGNSPATETSIKEIENKLKLNLPEDYKNLLRITNGFSAPNDIEPSFLPVEKILFLKDYDAELIEAYSIDELKEIGELLAKSILVGGLDEEQYFLLIPPSNDEETWKYWKFANWIPGEEAYESIEDYLKNVIEFNLEELKGEDI